MSVLKQSVFVINNMDCPADEALIRKRFGSVPGIAELAFNLMERRLTVGHTLSDEAPILAALRGIGLRAAAARADTCTSREADRAPAVPARIWALMAVSGIAAIGAEVLAWAAASETTPAVVALSLLSIATGGAGTLRKGWTALKSFSLNMNFLMSIAVIGAMAIGQWPEAAVVVFLFAVHQGHVGGLDDLRKLPRFIELSRRTSHVLRQNISLAIAIKGVFFALALAGQATLWMAVFADMGASLLVVANGLRLLRR